ncbi:hypothetical protein [Desulfotomaculum nigrificans]|uniref:hypothetical protein n=1 Tax=Desulfotomaculum nigrificans TaxID=1565 RepID=UPI0001FAE710|nr:hypothetical protein [Desulfotomaculum nigrificans]
MTHTLHRAGTWENLQNDYIVFAMAAQNVNRDGAAPKLRKALEIILSHNPVNFGDMKTGNKFSAGEQKVLEKIQDNSIVHGVFTDQSQVAAVLSDLKKADLGVSVVVSGLLEHVDQCCQSINQQRHTVEHSLGIWGNIARLPEKETLQVTTMCGHGMVAASLVEYLVEEIKNNRQSVKEAAQELARMCHCGVVNPVRAAVLLEEMARRG